MIIPRLPRCKSAGRSPLLEGSCRVRTRGGRGGTRARLVAGGYGRFSPGNSTLEGEVILRLFFARPGSGSSVTTADSGNYEALIRALGSPVDVEIDCVRPLGPPPKINVSKRACCGSATCCLATCCLATGCLATGSLGTSPLATASLGPGPWAALAQSRIMAPHPYGLAERRTSIGSAGNPSPAVFCVGVRE